jgi:glycine cleavage system H protein
MKRYTESHEWIQIEGKIATIGISDRAQHELGEIVHVELPPVGKVVSAGDETAVVESTKAATDLYAPLSGEVIAINDTLRQLPSLINQSAEDRGWLYKLRLSQPSEARALLEPAAYEQLFEG